MNNEIKMSDDELAELIRIKNHQEGMTFAQLSGFFVMMSKLRSTHHLVEINTHDKHLARIAELTVALKSLVYCAENNSGHPPSLCCYHRALDEAKQLLEQSK